MSNFRVKFLGLAAVATLFAGVSYGQVSGCTTQSVSAGVSTGSTDPGPSSMRAEGETELAGDLQGVCISGGATATALFTVFTSAPATSKPNANNVAGGPVLTEATLFICSSAATTTTGTPTTSYCTNGTGAAPFSTVYGTISGNQISFSGVGLPGTPTFTFRLSNIRMNASAVTLTSTLTSATEQVLVSANNTSSAFSTATTVGYVFPSLQVTTLRPTPTSNVAPTVKSFVTCTGNPVQSSLINPPVPSVSWPEAEGPFRWSFQAFEWRRRYGAGSRMAAQVKVERTSRRMAPKLAWRLNPRKFSWRSQMCPPQ